MYTISLASPLTASESASRGTLGWCQSESCRPSPKPCRRAVTRERQTVPASTPNTAYSRQGSERGKRLWDGAPLQPSASCRYERHHRATHVRPVSEPSESGMVPFRLLKSRCSVSLPQRQGAEATARRSFTGSGPTRYHSSRHTWRAVDERHERQHTTHPCGTANAATLHAAYMTPLVHCTPNHEFAQGSPTPRGRHPSSKSSATTPCHRYLKTARST